MQNRTDEEIVETCRRVLAISGQELGTLSICKGFARDLLAVTMRRMERKSSSAEFVTYRFDSDSALEAMERN